MDGLVGCFEDIKRCTTGECDMYSFCLLNSVKQSEFTGLTGMVARASNADEDGFREMGKWLTSHGGYIHPSLTLGDSPTLGVR